MEGKVVAVVPAAGRGRRMGAALAKQYLTLGGLPLVTHACLALERTPEVAAVVLAAPPGQAEDLRARCLDGRGLGKVARVVEGGGRRQDSVRAGCLAARELGATWVVIHDAARPLARPELFSRVIAAAGETGAAIAAWPCVDTVKQDDGRSRVARTLDRARLWLAQTPQAFRLQTLLKAQEEAEARGMDATDEAALMEAVGGEVRLVMGSRDNLKITTPEDLRLAGALMGRPAPVVRVGQGMDVHRLVPGRPLVLGGVRIEYELGLLGHSDADVLTHAVMDALLAAAGLGDIGRLFPDSDPAYKDADSIMLLGRVKDMLTGAGWRPAQVSVTLVAQRPKIAPHAEGMRANLARALGLEASLINVAATTSEGLGFAGRGEGMAALATATLTPIAEQGNGD